MGRNGKAYVNRHYRWDVILTKYERMIARLRTQPARTDACRSAIDHAMASASPARRRSRPRRPQAESRHARAINRRTVAGAAAAAHGRSR